MNGNMNKIIQRFILLPLAIKVLKHDSKHFSDFKMGNVYLGKLDSTMMNLQEDVITTRKLMYTKYHINVKQIGSVAYRWESRNDSGVITYTPDELKSMTSDVIKRYLYGDKATAFEVKEGWK